MFNLLFRLFLALNATSLLLVIYAVKEGVLIWEGGCFYITRPAATIFSFALYALVPILLTAVSIKISSFLGKDSFYSGNVVEMEHANNSFLPSYLGYFFVALSIPNIETLVFVYGTLFIFTFLSQALYFNPLFLVFGYEFYNVKTKSGAHAFIISKKKYKIPNEIVIINARRINNYTFMEG